MYKTILAIESSCDETGVAIVEGGIIEVASALATSQELHKKTGGVVPEVAARKQLEYILPVIAQCLEKAQVYYRVGSISEVIERIDAIAVTVGPGLSGSLIVGVESAKALALSWNKPLIPVNHLIGHLYANFIGKTANDLPSFPAVGLVISGGHTDLILIKDHYKFEYLGGTLDDAAGECFDKSARLLGISDYLGGSLLSELARKSNNSSINGVLPRPLINEDNFDFSFSGLKTAVRRLYDNNPKAPIEDISAEVQSSIVEVVSVKVKKAVDKYKVKCVLVGGGVSANLELRKGLNTSINVPIYFPEYRLCTDNAIYIASAAYFKPIHLLTSEVVVNPGLSVTDII